MKKIMVAMICVLGLLSALPAVSFAQDSGVSAPSGTPPASVTPPASTPAASTAQPSGLLLPFDLRGQTGVDVSTLTTDEDGNRLTGVNAVIFAVQKVFLGFRPLLGPLLVMYFAWLAMQLIFARGNEETFNKVAQHFFYVILGVVIISFANFLSETFSLYSGSTGNETTFLSGTSQIEGAASALSRQIAALIKFVRYVLGGVAVFYIVKSGATIMFASDDETVTQQKEIFIYGFVGLILIMIAEAVINTIFGIPSLPASSTAFGSWFATPSVNVGGGISLLSNLTNLLLSLLGGLFLFTLVAGGALYSFSAGNEERGQQATKLIIGSLMGLVIAFGSYTIVAEFSSGGRELPIAPTQTVPLGNVTPESASPSAR